MLEQFAGENNNKTVTDFLRFSEDQGIKTLSHLDGGTERRVPGKLPQECGAAEGIFRQKAGQENRPERGGLGSAQAGAAPFFAMDF